MLAAPRPAHTSDRGHSAPPILLAGFEPFGGHPLNPSWLIAAALHRRQIAGHRVLAAQLPTVFGASLARLHALLDQHRPALVVCLGLAAGRSALSIERVAINVNDARIPDNAGAQPVDAPIVADGPAAYFATLPVKAIVRALRLRGFPAGVSQTAGTFVCNHVFYGLMHHTAGQALKAGFIHVPFLPEQAADRPERPPSMALRDIVDALRIAVEVAVVTEDDAAEAGGATH